MIYDLENNRLVENWPEPKKPQQHLMAVAGTDHFNRVMTEYQQALAAYNNRRVIPCADECQKVWTDGQHISEKDYTLENSFYDSTVQLAYPVTKEAGERDDLAKRLMAEYDEGFSHDFSAWTDDERKDFLEGFLHRVAKPFMYVFYSLGLKTHITTKVTNDSDGTIFDLSFTKLSPVPELPNLAASTANLSRVKDKDAVIDQQYRTWDKFLNGLHILCSGGVLDRSEIINELKLHYHLSRMPPPQPAQPAGQGDSGIGVAAIAKERRRQIEIEKWDYSHDEHYKNGELIGAAACYAVNALNKLGIKSRVQIYLPAETNIEAGNTGDRGDRQLRKAGWYDAWPWDSSYDKREKHDVSRSLEISGALVAAAIDVLQPQAAARYHYPKASTPVDHYGEGLTELAKEIERQKEVITEQDQQLIKYRQTIDDLQSQLSLLQSREGKILELLMESGYTIEGGKYGKWEYPEGRQDPVFVIIPISEVTADLFTQFLNETGEAK
jgi:hypothetical protein